MILKSPLWGRGCLALAVGALLYYGGRMLLNAMGVTVSPVVWRVLGLIILLAITRWVLNEIFD